MPLSLALIRNGMIVMSVRGFQRLPILNRPAKRIHSRFLCLSRISQDVVLSQQEVEEAGYVKEQLPDTVWGAMDPHVLYSTHIADNTSRMHYAVKKRIAEKLKRQKRIRKMDEAIPLIIEQNIIGQEVEDSPDTERLTGEKRKVFYPYSHSEKIYIPVNDSVDSDSSDSESSESHDLNLSVREEIALRMKAYEEGVLEELDTPKGNLERKGADDLDIDNEEGAGDLHILRQQHGSADPSYPVSDVPCGGCGAPLHCQQPSLMGFVPKELFKDRNRGELRNLLCQRCYFLRVHKVALNVRVTPEDYIRLLEPIKRKRALVLVVVDLLDVPCSIWPSIIDIVGTNKPVMIVGNKVDLLPADGKNHLQRVRSSLLASIANTPLSSANICHVALVSSETGYGIENLITKIQNYWGTKGDIYILGCTNSGKSTLFNALLGSDMCKTAASTLIRRATVSPWPGTTLNMLKFPVLRPSGYRLFLRVKRLKEQQKMENQVMKPMYTKNILVGTLSGHIGRTLEPKVEVEERVDPFSVNMRKLPVEEQKPIMGINPLHEQYVLSKWCYDTPGTVQPEQLINLLSHEELMKVLPRHLLQPRTYCLKSGHSILVAGLARLDLLYSPKSVRFTVFRSKELPLTIVKTVDAASVYRQYLGTSLLGVPTGGEDRLRYWPVLKPVNLRTQSHNKLQSCVDVILSSAGWVSVSGLGCEQVIELRAWTPGGRGIHLRDPPLLPLAVNLRGARIGKSVAYRPHKIFVPH